jgi:hypothetical protein
MSDTSETNDGSFPRPLRAFDARINGWAHQLSGWQGLFIGAITIAVGQNVAEWLPLSDLYSTLALFPITLALLYVQLFVAARYFADRTGGC